MSYLDPGPPQSLSEPQAGAGDRPRAGDPSPQRLAWPAGLLVVCATQASGGQAKPWHFIPLRSLCLQSVKWEHPQFEGCGEDQITPRKSSPTHSPSPISLWFWEWPQELQMGGAGGWCSNIWNLLQNPSPLWGEDLGSSPPIPWLWKAWGTV